MRIALGQINPTVGDLAGNVSLMVEAARRASDLRADLIAFPELSLTGYPPRDLVEKESFVERSECELLRLARETAGLPIAIVCGYVGKVARRGRQAGHQQRGDSSPRRGALPAGQDAAADLRRLR